MCLWYRSLWPRLLVAVAMLTVTTLPQAKLVREAPVGAAASSRHPAKPPVAHLRNHFWAGEVGVMGGAATPGWSAT